MFAYSTVGVRLPSGPVPSYRTSSDMMRGRLEEPKQEQDEVQEGMKIRS